MNPGPSRSGSGTARSTSSPTAGAVPKAVPKVKPRKKLRRPPSQPLPYPQFSHPLHPHTIPPQLASRMHQHSPTNGHFQSNIAPSNSNGLPQSNACKNIPKNQLLFDWQSGEVLSSPRRNCRNRHTSSELYDSASDESVSQDNRHTTLSNSFRGILSEINGSVDAPAAHHFHRLRMNGNGQDMESGSPLESASHGMSLNNGSSRNMESKRINIPSSPERAQVEHRLSQIQDYIKQTSSLIDSYRLSSVGATDVPNTEFLVGVLKDLRDSEAKLKTLLFAFDQISLEDSFKSSAGPSGTEVPSQVLSPQEPQLIGNDHPVNAVATASKSADSKKQNEIKVKFEESLRQLHALQAEQTLLIQKRSEAQEQLQEAQRARNILLAMSSNGCPVNAQGDSAPVMGLEEQREDDFMNSLEDVDRHLLAFKGKNQVITKAESHQASHSRKRQTTEASDMTTYLKELMTGDEVKEQASSEDSAVEDAIDEYAEARAQVRLQGQIVQDKVAEINALRAQLDQAKSLLNLAQRRDTRSQTSDNNSTDEAATDQAVNIQRQRIGDGEATAPNQLDSRIIKTASKQQMLDQERAKLGRLRAMLATIQEYRSSGRPVPEHIMNEFGGEVQSSGSRSTSPAHTTGSLKGVNEEDAAVEDDVEEDDEPESTTQWNHQHISLVESASMASELSQGLQQRAAQLQIERDGLAAMQQQLDGLFNQLQQHQTAENAPDTSTAGGSINTASLHVSSPSILGPTNGQENKRVEESTLRRMEILSDLHGRWQLLQDEIASDEELSIKAAPVLSAAKSALNLLATHILPEAEDESAREIAWDQRSVQDRGQSTPARSDHMSLNLSQDRQLHEGAQMSSAPSTLIRRKPATDMARNQRAIWSSANAQDTHNSYNNTLESSRYNTAQSEENPPIVSMPSPSPSILQQQAQEMKNRLAAMSHSCQSLFMDSVDGVTSSPALPLMPAVAIPPPPPPTSGSSSHDREAYYQQLLAAGQLQQHQVLLTAVNQCFHILKMQQHELLNLSNSVHMLTSGASHVPPVGVHSGVLPSVHHGVHHGPHPIVNAGVHPGVHPSLLQSEEQWPNPSPAPGPGPPTLNNQVPPGNRTNNYWDNFRSYSRQNLLSASGKSNEGLPHSPSPLVERSHNSLRSSTPMSVPGASSVSVTSAMPQFHTLSTQPCLPGVSTGLAHPAGVADSAGMPIGAVGPAPPTTMDLSHPSPLVQNISRKDKRNIDHTDGGQGSPRRRPSNEIDHRTATRVLDDAALPMNSQMLSPTPQDFEVPSMPILRNSVVTLQSRLNQVNLNAPPSLANLQDFIETQNTRQQLNNEGVPFSEISSSLSSQQFNEFGGYCSLDHTREGSRRLNMDYHNGTDEVEPSTSTVLKRNTGAIKRTYTTSQNSVHNPSGFTPNYQRNIHSSTVSHLSSSISSSNTENSNPTSKLSSAFPVSHSDTETVYKSAKQQSTQDAARNFNCVARRPVFQDEFHEPCSSSSSSRSRMHGINETDDHLAFRQDEDVEYEDMPTLRSVAFNNCQSSTSSLSSSSQNTSNVEVPTFGPSKNQLKESCFQIRKCPKYQSKSGSRSPLSDTAAAAAAAVAAVAQSSPSHRNIHRSSSKSQTANCQRVVNKNNQDYMVPNQISGQGQLFEELRESVYAEMTSLISTNGNKSHFLVQLLKDLQHISSDSVRQSVLQLIQLAVSRYQIDLTSLGLEGWSSSLEDEAEDDDESKRMETQRLPYAGSCNSSDQKGSISSSQEGETLMQLVLGLELAAVLSANSDEICSPNLIEDVRSRILQLIPSPQTTAISSLQSFNSPRPSSYIHSQIDSVLDCVLLKFQGRRIGDVRSEITSCVVNGLPIKLMYRSMVDFYSRNNMEAEAHSRREGPFAESAMSPSSHSAGASPYQYSQHSPHMDGRDAGLLAEASNGDLAEADQSHHTVNAVDGDGDSEADRDCSTEGPLSASASISESASTLLHVHVYQLSGAPEAIDSEPEVEALQEEGEAMSCAFSDRSNCRNDLVGAVGGLAISAVETNSQEDISEQWSLEQDCDRNDLDKEREREQGLDQVPTRLACDSDRDQENGEKHRSHHLAMPPNDPSS